MVASRPEIRKSILSVPKECLSEIVIKVSLEDNLPSLRLQFKFKIEEIYIPLIIKHQYLTTFIWYILMNKKYE